MSSKSTLGFENLSSTNGRKLAKWRPFNAQKPQHQHLRSIRQRPEQAQSSRAKVAEHAVDKADVLGELKSLREAHRQKFHVLLLHDDYSDQHAGYARAPPVAKARILTRVRQGWSHNGVSSTGCGISLFLAFIRRLMSTQVQANSAFLKSLDSLSYQSGMPQNVL